MTEALFSEQFLHINNEDITDFTTEGSDYLTATLGGPQTCRLTFEHVKTTTKQFIFHNSHTVNRGASIILCSDRKQSGCPSPKTTDDK